MTPAHWQKIADRILEQHGENTYRDFLGDVDCYVQDWLREVAPGLLVEQVGAVGDVVASRNDWMRKVA